MLAKTKNDVVIEYPMFQGDIEIFHDVKLPINWEGGPLGDYNYVQVEDTVAPDVPEGKQLFYGVPIKTNENKWKQTWELKDIPIEVYEEQKRQLEQARKAHSILLENGINLPMTQILGNTKGIVIAANQPTADGIIEL